MQASVFLHKYMELISNSAALGIALPTQSATLPIKIAFKIYAKALKTFFGIREWILCRTSSGLPSKIVFSEKYEWDELIKKNLIPKGFKVEFQKMDESVFLNPLVVPLTIPDMIFCIEHASTSSNKLIPYPSKNAFDICNDKMKFHQFMTQAGMAEYTPAIDVDNSIFPFVMKKRIDEGGLESHIINQYEDLLKIEPSEDDSEYFREELLLNQREYATHVLIRDGKIKALLNICYLFEEDRYIKGKDKYMCKYVCSCPHQATIEKILNKIGFEGLCCINYKEKDGQMKIFEINPRFGGSLAEYFSFFLRKL